MFTRSTLLTLCLLAMACTVTADDEEVVFRHGRLFPRLLSKVELDYYFEVELNLTLGLDLHVELNLNNLFRKRASARALTPTQLRSYYNIPNGANAGSGQTVAITVAYGASTVESDLALFSNYYKLPSCTTANGCFKKVDQTGGNNIPADDSVAPPNGWSGETSLDVQTIHAIVPNAKIILVCANSPSSADLYPAVKIAASLAPIVSMSWGGSEGSQQSSTSETIFSNGHNNGVSFFAATGDDGKQPGYPSTSPNVIGVGGTTTTQNSDGTLAAETAWSGSSGGCSAVYPMNAAQKNNAQAVNSCGSKKASPDISFDADPNTGVVVWVNGSAYQFGGTSLATPIASARTASVRAAGTISIFDAAYAYSGKAGYRDVTSGSDASYSAGSGYDLVTGLGVWTSDTAPASTTSSAAASTSSTKAATSSTSAQPTHCSGLLCLKRNRQ